MSEKIIEVQQLAKRFGNFEAVKDVNFTVYKGDVFGFLGPNGAGKSTSIRCLLSLIKPDRGEIKIFGQSLAHQRNQILARTGSIIESPIFTNTSRPIKTWPSFPGFQELLHLVRKFTKCLIL